MARLASCGFELGSLTVGEFTTVGGGSIVTSPVHSGSYAYRAVKSGSAGDEVAKINFPAVATTGAVYVRFYVYIATGSTLTGNIFGISDDTNYTDRFTLRLNNATLQGAKAGVSFGSSLAVTTGQWHLIELYVIVGPSNDNYNVIVDGVDLGSSSSAAGYSYDRITWGFFGHGGSPTVDVLFDDIAVNNTAGSYQNGAPGKGKIVHLRPNAAGDSSSWTPSAGSNYQCVDEVIPNDDTDYVSSSTTNQEDYYNVEASGLIGTETINVVAVSQRSKSITSSSTISVGAMKTEGGTKAVSGTVNVGTSYNTHSSDSSPTYNLITYQDPDGSNWTPSTVDTMQIGIKELGSIDTRVTTEWALVDYTPLKVVKSVATTFAVRFRVTKLPATSYKVYGPTTYGSLGTAGYSASAGAASITPAYPTGIAVNSGLVLLVGQKPTTANGGGVTTPSGWTLVASKTASGGYGSTLGADTGNTNLYAYFKVADGTESGTLTVSLTDSDVAWSRILRYESATGLWKVTGTTGEDTSAGNVSITGAATLNATIGASLIGAMCIPTDITTPSQFSAEAFSATGATFSSVTEVDEPDSSVGNDVGGFIARAYITAGTATDVPTMTATAVGTTTNVMGPGVFVLLQSAVNITSADTGSFVDDGTAAESTVSKSESDTASGVDSQSLIASATLTDDLSSVEAQSLLVVSTDVANLVDAESLLVTSDDLISSVDNEFTSATLTDVSSLAEAQSLSVTLTSSDASVLTDNETLVVSVSSSDTWIGADAQTIDVDQVSSDLWASVETQNLVAGVSTADSASLTDVGSVGTSLSDADDFLFLEIEEIEGGISEYITVEDQWSIGANTSSDDVWNGTDSEVLGQTDYDGSSEVVETETLIISSLETGSLVDTQYLDLSSIEVIISDDDGSFANSSIDAVLALDTESITAELTINESLSLLETSVINLTDSDSFTCGEVQDVAFSTFADDLAEATETEEVHELVYISDDDLLNADEQFVGIDAGLSTAEFLSLLDEASGSATLIEADSFTQSEDELSAGPTGVDLIVGIEEVWTDVTLSASDFGLSTDLGIVGQEEADLGTSSELESVSVGLYGDDSFAGLDTPLLTNLDDSDIGTSIEGQLLTADFIENDLLASVETNLTPGISSLDSGVVSEDLIVIDLFDADAGTSSEDLAIIEAESADFDTLSLADQGDAGASIGDEGLFLEQSGIDATNDSNDVFGYLDLGYVDIPVADDVISIELEQIISFTDDLTSLTEASLVEIAVLGDDLAGIETETIDSSVTTDEFVVSADAEFLEVLSEDTSAGVEAQVAPVADLTSDDPFLVIDDHQITQTTNRFDSEDIAGVEALLLIDLNDEDLSSSSDLVSGFGFADPDLGISLESSVVGQVTPDLMTGSETQSLVVNIFSSDSFAGMEDYLGTELSSSDSAGMVEFSGVFAGLSEADLMGGSDLSIEISLIDDDLFIGDEVVTDLLVSTFDNDDVSLIEVMVAIEAGLATSEDFILFDTQSYFLGDSFTDDETTIDVFETESVVQVLTDNDSLFLLDEESLPGVIPQGFQGGELTIMRKLTIMMIKTNPIAIALIPEIQVRKENGTLSYEDGLARPIQIFRLIPMSYQTKPTQIVDGVERVVDYTLLGRWDAQMERGDHWIGADGKRYRIIELVPYMPYAYETKGLIECHG